MTLLGLRDTARDEADAGEEVTRSASLKAEMFKRAALGSGSSIGVAIVFGAYELLHNEPHDAFPLLKSWGPWAIVAIVAIYAAYDIVKMVIAVGGRLASAVERLATAQQKSADKDDRQLQETQTLTAYTAQQTEKMHEKLNLILSRLDAQVTK